MGRLALSKGVLIAAWLATGMTIGANMYLGSSLPRRGSVGLEALSPSMGFRDFGNSGGEQIQGFFEVGLGFIVRAFSDFCNLSFC